MAKFYAVKEGKKTGFTTWDECKEQIMVIQELFINLLQMKKRQKHL